MTMKVLIFFLVAGYAVRCDDSNYYVVEMEDNGTQYKDTRRQFNVYWNVPTMQCMSKRIPFDNLYQKYGILQNKNDRFRGEVISILYDPGLFPALLKNESSGRFKFRNGGVPQEGDMERHLSLFRSVLEQSIPDREFKGIGIIDFESWRPIFRQNFGVLVPYKDVSYELEKKLHWWWPTAWVQAQAKQRFEEGAHAFMETTLAIAKEMRPHAAWGYYGFPYCFNMANNNFKGSCADRVPEENDRLKWLWSESSALFPSVYSSKDLTSSQLAALIRGRVEEAERVNRKAIVLPYFWFRYRDAGYFSENDLKTAISTLYKSNISGFIIWGSSNDVNTIAKCTKLLDYLETIMGPAIAEYTKPTIKIRDKHSTTNLNNEATASPQAPNDIKHHLDPEYHWVPPENYTKDIEQYVEEEIKKKSGYTVTDNSKVVNETRFKVINDSYLIDWLVNNIKVDNNTILNETDLVSDDGEKQFIIDNPTTVGYGELNNDLEASQPLKDSVTENYNNLDVRLKTTKVDSKDILDYYTTPNMNDTVIINEETESESEAVVMDLSTTEYQSKPADIEPYFITEENNTDHLIFNRSNTIDGVSYDFTTETNTKFESKYLESSTIRYKDFDSTKQYKDVTVKYLIKTTIKEEKTVMSTLMTPASTALDQVRSGSNLAVGHKPYICLIFYIYSVSKCLCEVFGKCS